MNLKPKSEFASNVLKMMSGTTIGQAIPILVSPILTRLFTPIEFGVYALFMSISTIASTIATGRYELAIMLPSKKEEALDVFFVSLIIALITSSVTFLILIFFKCTIANLLGQPDIKNMLLFVPLLVFLNGTYQSYYYLNNRSKNFHTTAVSKIVDSGGRSSTNILIGYLKPAAFGLVIGNIVGRFLSLLTLIASVQKTTKPKFNTIDKQRLINAIIVYRKFPLFDIFSAILFTAYKQVNIIFFNKFFSGSIAGLYYMTQRILRMPVSFFVAAFSDVFYQRISRINDAGTIAYQVNHYMKKIFLFSFIPYFIFVYSSYYYVEIIFGNDWGELYKYFYIFAVPTYITLLLSPFSYFLRTINKQDLSLILHLSKFLTIIVVLYYIALFYNNMIGLQILAFFDSILQIIIGIYIYYKVKSTYNTLLLISLAGAGTMSIIHYLILI